MKKIILLIILYSTYTFCESKKVVHFVTNEWIPYMTKADDGFLSDDEIKVTSKANGILTRLVSMAFKQEGYHVMFHSYPQARAFHNASKGNLNGAVGWNRNQEREKKFYYSDPLMEKERVFFYIKAHRFNWKTMKDLKDLIIGADISTNYSKEFTSAEKSKLITVQRVSLKKTNFRKLLNRQIHIYPMIKKAGYKILNKYFLPKESRLITHHPRALQKTTWHLIFNKKKKENRMLLLIFNRGLKKLKEMDYYQDIFNYE